MRLTTEDAIRILTIELQKARSDFYPDRRLALQMAIDALTPQEVRMDKASSAIRALDEYLRGGSEL